MLQYIQHVLAGRYEGDGQFRFVTWQMNGDQTGLAFGHYFDRNEYEKAKDDFIQRSGLLEHRRLFNKERLIVLYSTLLYRSIHDSKLGFGEKQDMDRLIHKIEAMAPTPTSESVQEATTDSERDWER